MRWEPTLHFHCARHFSVVFNLHSYSLRYALISPFFRWKNRIPEILYAFFGHTPTTVALSDSNSSKFYFIVAHHNIFPKTSLYAFCVVEITPHSCGYLTYAISPTTTTTKVERLGASGTGNWSSNPDYATLNTSLFRFWEMHTKFIQLPKGAVCTQYI